MEGIGRRSPFFSRLREEISRLGGMHNAHLHLDRANTLDDRYFEHAGLRVLDNSYISLQKKHALINAVHAGPAYEADDLTGRVNDTVDVMVAAGTTRADTMVDVTDDRVGLSALQLLGSIRDARRHEIDLRLAAYSPLGFLDSEPGRWAIFEQGVKQADFIGSLPEADDHRDYPDNIGFEEHCARMLDLARRVGKMLHVHTDQRNEAGERGTERLVEVMRGNPGPASTDGTPMVWAVHMISPTRYDERRHRKLVDGLLELNVGLICCPSAALGMRQIRSLTSPTDNSIPRILDLVEAGVHVRLGSDNVADICSPSTTADLIDEVFVLTAAIRYYEPSALAHLAAGRRLSGELRAQIREHLERNRREMLKVVDAGRAAAF